jgi:hypothetical protein
MLGYECRGGGKGRGIEMIARFAIVVVTLLTTSSAFAETLTAEAARRFVAGKLFAFNCFDGSRGAGRIYTDGSVIGNIQFRGAGPMKQVWLPAGTLRVRGESVCPSTVGAGRAWDGRGFCGGLELAYFRSTSASPPSNVMNSRRPVRSPCWAGMSRLVALEHAILTRCRCGTPSVR